VSGESEGSGVLLLRAWLHDGQLVARLQSSRSGEPGQRAEVAVGMEQIEKTVQRWLRDLGETAR
jgi:hypothetical protein